ncbi:hypothetical protein E4T56_gene235 [Termitomyces sp. T112]|nr:hypothetical protein E4T56_gene235 [Termitomyces sp. T112]
MKALLLDQSFSAGVGNWVADEILYNARIHPEHRCNTLSLERLTALHHYTSKVCTIAVAANADDRRYPDHWLFKHRWGKGKKEHSLRLPSGDPATIKWVTVGGRTSAYVEELQTLPVNPIDTTKKRIIRKQTAKTKRQADVDEQSDLTPLSDSSEYDVRASPTKKQKSVHLCLEGAGAISEYPIEEGPSRYFMKGDE